MVRLGLEGNPIVQLYEYLNTVYFFGPGLLRDKTKDPNLKQHLHAGNPYLSIITAHIVAFIFFIRNSGKSRKNMTLRKTQVTELAVLQ